MRAPILRVLSFPSGVLAPDRGRPPARRRGGSARGRRPGRAAGTIVLTLEEARRRNTVDDAGSVEDQLERWSPYGAPWLQMVAISGKSDRRRTCQNKPKPLPSVATSCVRSSMVRRGSTVRVRQRALQKRRTSGPLISGSPDRPAGRRDLSAAGRREWRRPSRRWSLRRARGAAARTDP